MIILNFELGTFILKNRHIMCCQVTFLPTSLSLPFIFLLITTQTINASVSHFRVQNLPCINITMCLHSLIDLLQNLGNVIMSVCFCYFLILSLSSSSLSLFLFLFLSNLFSLNKTQNPLCFFLSPNLDLLFPFLSRFVFVSNSWKLVFNTLSLFVTVFVCLLFNPHKQ